MFRRNLLPVWIGIIILSGMFLMGQEAWEPDVGLIPDPNLEEAIRPSFVNKNPFGFGV